MHPELLNNPTFLRYHKAWQADPRSLVFAPLAEFFCEYGLFADARKVCEAGVKHHPHSVIAHYTLAKVYTYTREWHAARHEVLWVTAQAPDHVGGQQLLAKIDAALTTSAPSHELPTLPPARSVPPVSTEHFSTASQLTSAEIHSLIASVTPPDTPAVTEPLPPKKISKKRAVKPPAWVTVTMARIYAEQGHYTQARRIYETILDRDPQNAEAIAGLATVRERTEVR